MISSWSARRLPLTAGSCALDAEPDPPRKQSVNILIVDDRPSDRLLLRRQIEREGHQVREATNGAEALQMLGTAPVDGVVSDIIMPIMDGFRLCREIRKNP